MLNRTENGSETQLSMQANHYHFRAKFNDFQSTERMARLSSAAVAASQSGAAAINQSKSTTPCAPGTPSRGTDRDHGSQDARP